MKMLLAALALLSLVAALPVVGEAVTIACVGTQLPVTPVQPAFTLNTSSVSSARLDIWRHTCLDGTGFAILIRVTPMSPSPSVCFANFDVVQGTAQYDVGLVLNPTTGANLCGNVLVPVTAVLIATSVSNTPFNYAQAFTLFHEGYPPQSVEIPAAGGTPPGPPTLTVHAVGCTTCHAGNTLGFELHVTNPGPPMVVELKTGARLPGGLVVSILGRHEEELLPTGVTVIPLFSGLVLPPGTPAGAYVIEAALLEPEVGVTLSRSSVTLTLGP